MRCTWIVLVILPLVAGCRLFFADSISCEVDAHCPPAAGRCVDQVCVFGPPPAPDRDAGDFDPADAADLDAGDPPVVPDAGRIDAGDFDAGVVDAGLVDAGVVDAGVVDAGVVDAGLADAGLVDAGFVEPWRALEMRQRFELRVSAFAGRTADFALAIPLGAAPALPNDQVVVVDEGGLRRAAHVSGRTLYVQVPTVEVQMRMWVYFDLDPSGAPFAESFPFDPTFIGVFHFDDDLLEAQGGPAGEGGGTDDFEAASGFFGPNLRFNRPLIPTAVEAEHLVHIPTAGLGYTADSGSVSFWMRWDGRSAAAFGMVWHGSTANVGDGFGNPEIHIQTTDLLPEGGDDRTLGLHRAGSAASERAADALLADPNGWHHVGMTWDRGDLITLFVDGVAHGAVVFPGSDPSVDLAHINLGGPPEANGNWRAFVGGLDELRMSTTPRTQDHFRDERDNAGVRSDFGPTEPRP